MKFESKDKRLSIQNIYVDSLITSVQFQRDVDLPKVIAGLLLLKTGSTLANFGTPGNTAADPRNTAILMTPSVLIHRGQSCIGL